MFSMFNVVGRVGAMKQLEFLKKLALPKRNLVLCIGGGGSGFQFPEHRSLVRSSLTKMQVHLEGVELSMTWKESQPQPIKYRKTTTATMQGQLYLEPATELGKTARARASWRFAPKFQRVTVPRQCVRGPRFPTARP